MKKINQMIQKKIVPYILFTLVGILAGWLLSNNPSDKESKQHAHEEQTHELEQEESGVWTCSMHPQIKLDKPGKCPICAMDLIPLQKNVSGDAPAESSDIQLSDEAVALADVQTTRVSKENPVKTIRLYGKIVSDERSLQSQTAYVGGRIEKLAVEFTGETVRKGQNLATIYSPELFTAQQELLQANQMQQPQLLQAAREKLRLWNMTEEQIDHILKSGKASPTVEIKANTSGIVTTKRVNRGDYVSQGSVLFDIANLSRVWAMFDAFETDLPYLNKNDKVEFTLPAFPGKKFSGRVSFIDPMLNPNTRTARVRVEVANDRLELKPEMYATAKVEASLKQYKGRIVIPQSAVLWTGKRSVVYVRRPDHSIPTFQLREIELGPALGGAYVVVDGLDEGEHVVTNGAFAIDASAQLEGKRSMMNNDGEQPHNQAHHGDTHTATSSLQHAMLTVKGNCDMCKKRIEQAAMGIEGVQSAHWDKKQQVVHLQFDKQKTSEKAISKAIAKAGHDTEMDTADDAVYNLLPACCQYRKQTK